MCDIYYKAEKARLSKEEFQRIGQESAMQIYENKLDSDQKVGDVADKVNELLLDTIETDLISYPKSPKAQSRKIFSPRTL